MNIVDQFDSVICINGSLVHSKEGSEEGFIEYPEDVDNDHLACEYIAVDTLKKFQEQSEQSLADELYFY